MSITTLALAKAHMNIDGSADDELIQLYLDAAETWLGAYTGKDLAALDPFPADLKLAVLKLAAFYYEQREAVGFGVTMQIAPYGVTSIADSYRERWFGEDEVAANG
jgi:uncharacterized phage protein (predicted DNA packaging)